MPKIAITKTVAALLFPSRPFTSFTQARRGAKKGYGSFVLPGQAFHENEYIHFP
jgi:hypothetical protein